MPKNFLPPSSIKYSKRCIYHVYFKKIDLLEDTEIHRI